LISNRQSSRRRGRGGSQRSSGGSQGGQRDSGNRIDSRTRGNAAQLLEKYRNMARDAQMSGDRVNTEYYLQFADHYFRVLSDSRSRQDDHRPVRPVDDFDAMDEEYGDEGEPIRSGDQGGYPEARANGHDQRQNDSRQHGQRNDGNRQEPRGEGERDDRRDYQSRDDRQRRDYQPRNSQNRDQPSRAPEPAMTTPEPQAANGAPYVNGEAEAAPKTERKPRSRSRTPAPAPEMEVASMEADRLPPSLGIVGEAVAKSEEEPAEAKPKRRRTPRAAPSELPAE
jgi:hypothetical protein